MLFNDITHLIFDLDGLLVDSEPLWHRAEEIILQQQGHTWEAGIAKQHTGLRLDEVARIMTTAYSLALEPATLEAQLIQQMFSLVQSELSLMPGAGDLLREAYQRGFTLAIASSSRKDYIETICQQMDWDAMITAMVSAYEVRCGKPAPDVYEQVLTDLEVAPSQCLAFEDSLNGAKAAQAAGLKVVVIPGQGFDAAEFEGIAHAIYPSLNALIPQLSQGA